MTAQGEDATDGEGTEGGERVGDPDGLVISGRHPAVESGRQAALSTVRQADDVVHLDQVDAA